MLLEGNISFNINHKLVQLIYKKSFPIHLTFSKKQFVDMVKVFYPYKNPINYSELVEKSNYNFHNIEINLKFYLLKPILQKNQM